MFAKWDYEEYYGGSKEWFVEGCIKDADNENFDCEEFEETAEKYISMGGKL
ncbi:MAG: hypothetical protein IKF90_10105 [Parasporobacterium sp.]|nr:hypothetical protein [Parasporobacterium sp.]